MGFCVQQSCRNYYLLEQESTCVHTLLPSSATGNVLLFMYMHKLAQSLGKHHGTRPCPQTW